jgi:hypothetical protein
MSFQETSLTAATIAKRNARDASATSRHKIATPKLAPTGAHIKTVLAASGGWPTEAAVPARPRAAKR